MGELVLDTKILKQFADKLTLDVKKEIPKVTGESAASVENYLTGYGFRIIANASVVTLIDGRPPTGAGFKKGSKTLQETIYEWIVNKGIVPHSTGKPITQIALSWIMSKSIHRKGTLLWQRGGVNNFLDVVFTDSRVQTFLTEYSGNLAERTLDYLTENIN